MGVTRARRAGAAKTLGAAAALLPGSIRRHARAVAALLVAVVAVIGSLDVLDGELVAGDVQFILENPAIRRADVVVTAFTRGYWWVGGEADAGSYYRPLLVLLDALDHALWGARGLGYHLTSTAILVAACVATLALVRRATRSHAAALVAALAFAAHPIHVQASSYVSARSTVLSAALYAAALASALRFRDDAGRGRARPRGLGVALACYAAGLLTLEATVTLPIALAVALLPARHHARAALARFAGAIGAVSALYLVARRLALGAVLSHKQDLWDLLSPLATLLTMAKTIAWYVVKLAWPSGLSYVPPFLPVVDARDATGWASLALVVALAAFALAGPRRLGVARAAVGLALVTLVPVCGLLPLDHFVKGHYAFLPSIGLAVLVGLGARRALRRRALRPVVAVAACAVVTLGVIGSLFANEAWQSGDALEARVLELEPETPDALFEHPVMGRTANRYAFMRYNVGTKLARAGRCAEALPEVRRARWLTRQRTMKQRADLVEAHCLLTLGDRAGALALYAPLVDALPNDATPPARAAAIHLAAGRTSEALPLLGLACARGDRDACATRDRLTP